MGTKLHEICQKNGRLIGYSFDCPGCDHLHAYWTVNYRPKGNPTWNFNGDVESPTFTPSLLNRGGEVKRCHLFVKAGVIEFCGDCTHELAGQKVPMVDTKPEMCSDEG